MARSKPQCRIGTSGFSYQHWRDVFYPPEVPQRRWLEHYAAHFDTVELNSTFYHLPRADTFDSWRERAGEGFCFALKISRFITHRKYLVDCREPLALFLGRAERLEDRLGPLLIQLPPALQKDVKRLDGFLRLCPRRRRWAVEFRNPTWLCPEVFEVLREHGAALCIHDLVADHPEEVTAGFVYRRFHGSGKRYGGSYSARTLAASARQIRGWLQGGLDVFAYFNNDQKAYAVSNARDLKHYVLKSPKS